MHAVGMIAAGILIAVAVLVPLRHFVAAHARSNWAQMSDEWQREQERRAPTGSIDKDGFAT